MTSRVFLILLASGALLGQTPADQPAPRTDRNSQIAHAELLEKARKGRIDIYFAGDSITRRWGTSDEQYKEFLENWNQNFFGWNAANFGWGADRIQNILWRLHNGELDGVNPKIIVLMAGTNNLGGAAAGNEDAQVEDIARGIKAALDVMREKAPNAAIVLMGITPRAARGSSYASKIAAINERISAFADGKRIRFLNLNDKLGDRDGRPIEGMTVDGLHLSVKGYQVWADALKPIFTEILGPPAKTDRAPPPTGDPSARKPSDTGKK